MYGITNGFGDYRLRRIHYTEYGYVDDSLPMHNILGNFKKIKIQFKHIFNYDDNDWEQTEVELLQSTKKPTDTK